MNFIFENTSIIFKILNIFFVAMDDVVLREMR